MLWVERGQLDKTFRGDVEGGTTYTSRNSFRSINFMVSLKSSDAEICGNVWILLPFLRCTLSGFESSNATAGPRHSVTHVSRGHCTGANKQHTQHHKHDVRSPVQLSQRSPTVVERQIDRTTENTAAIAIRQPVSQVLPSILWRRIAEHYSALCCPEKASSDPTGS